MVRAMSEKHPTYGYKRITAEIKRIYNTTLDSKTVLRYRQYLGIKALQPKKQSKVNNGLVVSKIAPNIINRNFKPIAPNLIWSVDITYVPQGDGNRSYLFAIKDLYDKSIVAYSISRDMSISFVLNAMKKAISENDVSNLIVHSDQGVHFTCGLYIRLLEEAGITISHSRRGNCYDNAPIESFFSLYKREALWLEKPYDYEDAKNQIDNYMLYYNQQRIQIGLNGKTPSEIRLSA